ncbi:MAG: Arc family DNA-binding protein [Candidatus Thermoplasmatota archaeon]|nr:Arc family DNA-binding protein [Candidatus Thermoplasmatota archaeon]
MDEPTERPGSRDITPLPRSKVEKKRVLLRIDPALHNDLRVWAEDDFRSINAQIEFLLKQAVTKRKEPKANR